MSENFSSEEIKKLWPNSAPPISNIQKYVDKYKDISPCLLLYFNTDPSLRPIRKHKFEEYQALLDNYTI